MREKSHIRRGNPPRPINCAEIAQSQTFRHNGVQSPVEQTFLHEQILGLFKGIRDPQIKDVDSRRRSDNTESRTLSGPHIEHELSNCWKLNRFHGNSGTPFHHWFHHVKSFQKSKDPKRCSSNMSHFLSSRLYCASTTRRSRVPCELCRRNFPPGSPI